MRTSLDLEHNELHLVRDALKHYQKCNDELSMEDNDAVVNLIDYVEAEL